MKRRVPLFLRPKQRSFSRCAAITLARFSGVWPSGLVAVVTLQGRTLFKDLKLLPPASIWNFRYGRRQECGVYFAIEAWSQQAKLSSRDYEDKLRETFSSILQRYLPGDRSIAMSLTGGLDGRMIMAWARVPPNELPC